MKKVLLMVVITMALFLFACGDNTLSSKNDDETTDNEVTDNKVTNDETPDQDSDSDYDEPHGDDFGLSSFLEPLYDNYFTLRQTGIIFDYNNAEIDPKAIASESKTKLGALSMDGDWGAYFNYNNSLILFQAHGYDFIKTDEANKTTRMQLVSSLGRFTPALITSMVENKICEVDFGAYTSIKEVYIDARFDNSGVLTEQNIRRNCIIGVSKMQKIEEGGKTFDLPVGKIYGCFDEDQVGALGETLKMMFNLEMTIDEEKILEFINTRDDGTVALENDEDYEPNSCTCFSLYEKDAEGEPVEIDCKDFDPDEPLFPAED
ncbi:hypothetical protein KAH37_09425 [bacterium]|nr:hypothetical protein [bacterium]